MHLTCPKSCGSAPIRSSCCVLGLTGLSSCSACGRTTVRDSWRLTLVPCGATPPITCAALLSLPAMLRSKMPFNPTRSQWRMNCILTTVLLHITGISSGFWLSSMSCCAAAQALCTCNQLLLARPSPTALQSRRVSAGVGQSSGASNEKTTAGRGAC